MLPIVDTSLSLNNEDQHSADEDDRVPSSIDQRLLSHGHTFHSWHHSHRFKREKYSGDDDDQDDQDDQDDKTSQSSSSDSERESAQTRKKPRRKTRWTLIALGIVILLLLAVTVGIAVYLVNEKHKDVDTHAMSNPNAMITLDDEASTSDKPKPTTTKPNADSDLVDKDDKDKPKSTAKPNQDESKSDDRKPMQDQHRLALEAHNKFRKMHGVADLIWSDKLAQAAQKWFEVCEWEHSKGKVGPYGENLFAVSASGIRDPTGGVESWYNEIEDYDFATGKFSMGTGHLTQVLWKGTKSLGCHIGDCDLAMWDGMNTYFVCEYEPPGNVMGAFQENVPPPL
ncbi:hypothetical protein OIO90_004292 [Microbotryomycetes sp. JL221]|nr:hypothetical protein OIO90_004292 [Microbotryomycetes sp. JL221]